MPNRKKSQKIFGIMNPFLYFCTHERKNLASLRKYSPYALTRHSHSLIGSLHAHPFAL